MSECVPVEDGYYFASLRPTKNFEGGAREIVRIGQDGFGHTRAFRTRASRGYNPCEFENYSERIEDPGAKHENSVKPQN